ncbi:MAG: protein translocase subunit SecD [Proteobacteria bacterium]|nr:protein translocase subunit SecD [Pseudomonadota bacterium]
MKSILLRILMLAAFTAVAFALFLPSTPFSSILPSAWNNAIPKMILGLDLQGGMHLVLNVDREKAVENRVQRIKGSIEEALREEKVPYRSVKMETALSVGVGVFNERNAEAIQKVVDDEFPGLEVETASDGSLTYSLPEDEQERIKSWALSQALETIRNRIDKFGVAEPLIQKQGISEVAIQLPGLKDPERAMELIGKTAVLEFRIVDDSMEARTALMQGAPFGSEVLYQNTTDPATGETIKKPFLLYKEIMITGDSLSDARVSVDSQFNEPYVSLTFDSDGAHTFSRVTTKYVDKRLAIVLDGNVYSAPNINEPITGGKAQVSGNFTYESARDLAIVLRAGALPAPVEIIQNVTVGPTLGRDSIEAGLRAAALGFILVLLFMLVYYRVAGAIADFAILLNVVMLLGMMGWLNATLTLPGIAGIILTVGMGVDSNVLIFERIKEELRGGRTPRSAVNAGYERAWWTIVDSNVTTLITAFVLFQFGSGPIKGFAVTLSLGILINLFTSLVGTKVAFDVQNDKLRLRKLSI